MSDFWKETFKQLGISTVLVIILLVYYSGENSKWEHMQAEDSKRWQQLFDKYTTDQKTALETISACCHAQRER